MYDLSEHSIPFKKGIDKCVELCFYEKQENYTYRLVHKIANDVFVKGEFFNKKGERSFFCGEGLTF
jgi:hypothetical protein